VKYLDATTFTDLFRARQDNHAEICLGLHRLAANIGRRLRFHDSIEREDAVAHALVYAIERIDRFHFQRGHNAFNYFTSLLYRRMINRLAHERRSRRPTMFSDLQHGSGDRWLFLEESAVPYALAG
jgi:DNA-directed RNA polymerase specialized sigma24 family protein